MYHYTAFGAMPRLNVVSIRIYNHRRLNYNINKAVYPTIDKATSIYQCSRGFCSSHQETIMLHLLYLVGQSMLPRGEICSCYTVNHD